MFIKSVRQLIINDNTNNPLCVDDTHGYMFLTNNKVWFYLFVNRVPTTYF